MVGQTVGKYRIVSRLGRGGMGTVYKAVDESLDREVAIKVLNPDLGDPEILRRFRAEAMTLARLNHPNIATLYEFAQHEDDLLMVMEFVRGETFDRVSDRFGPLPFDRAATLCSQVLDALGHAHRANIVHRDLKPANLMVTDSGLVKVMDFGIARVAGTEHLTTDGYMMGTPAYMAPEQVMGNEVDGRADLYSMGVVLYRLLTANLPFKAETAIAMAQKQIKDPPTPLRQFRAELPSWCQDILDRALAKAPGDRFQTAEEFRAALTRVNVPIVKENVGSTAALAAATGISGTDLTVPPNVMITPVSGVNTGSLAGDLPETVLTASPAKPVPAPVANQTPPKRPARPSTTPLVLSALAIALTVIVGLTMMRMRRAPGPTAPPITVAAVDGAPPAQPQPAPAPAPTPAAAAVTPPPAPTAPPTTRDTGQPSGATAVVKAARPPAGKPATESAPVVPAASPVDTPAAPPLPATPSTTLPSVTFKSVDLLTFDAGKSRDREASLTVGDGALQVIDGEDRLRHAPYDTIIGIYYSHSRDPRWINPAGTVVPVVKADTGHFRMFRGGSDWLTVRTKTEFILLKVESAAITKIIGVLESHTGLKVVRVGERD